jgi:hypothetical protein
MRYTQYTHKVSIPMRKELYDFLSSLPRGSRTDMGRNFFLIIKAMMDKEKHKESRKLLPQNDATSSYKYILNKLTRGKYVIWLEYEEGNET